MSLVVWLFSIMIFNSCFGFLFALMKILFGILSGTGPLFQFGLCIVPSISLSLIFFQHYRLCWVVSPRPFLHVWLFFRPHLVFTFAFSVLVQVFKVVGYVFFCFCWIFDLCTVFSVCCVFKSVAPFGSFPCIPYGVRVDFCFFVYFFQSFFYPVCFCLFSPVSQFFWLSM